ncbi:MAG: hypothetical protein SH847_26970 [Roseiflexaceae bacterium]|nr:hypothetical protein [Roseiflexaceae bacterium]
MITIQYLEDSPDLQALDQQEVIQRLREACAILPISAVLIGWNLPPALLEACAYETRRAGVALYRWHPLLTSDGGFELQPEWLTIGAGGEPVPGFQGMPEFTFVCPNRPAVRAALLARLQAVLHAGPYQGVFLDRIRFPSPAADPVGALACFCPDCFAAAAAEGLDLTVAQQRVLELGSSPVLIQALFDNRDPQLAPFLAFRQRTITRFINAAAAVARAEQCAVGLDGFSPAIAPLVGQDLGALDRCADWTKIMSYGHTLGPAGIPFELLGVANWLITVCKLDETVALQLLAQACGLGLPARRALLQKDGIGAAWLAAEVIRAQQQGVQQVLFGIELVELEGITTLHSAQIQADLRAVRATHPAGLAISWDLRFIAPERLRLLAETWQ